MPSNFPTSLPGLKTDFDSNDLVASADQNDQALEINAIGAKVGADSSAVVTSHDYKLSGVTGTDKAVSKTGTETLTNKTLTNPTVTTGSFTTPILTTPVINGAVTGTITPPLTFYSNLNLSEGQMINGKIVPSVASNNLTVALKGMDGNDPSATNPVYVRIGNVVRSITAGVSLLDMAGGNTYNTGDAKFATKEVDYFVYLSFKSASSTIALGICRIPYATVAGNFSASSLDETYCYTNSAAATDPVVNIGRFAATHSAGAGYTWSVPTFTATNLIQRPIYETRLLDWVPAWTINGTLTTTYSTQSGKYKLNGKSFYFNFQFILDVVSAADASKRFNIAPPISTTLMTGLINTAPIGSAGFFDTSTAANNTFGFLSYEDTDKFRMVNAAGSTYVGESPAVTLATGDRFGGFIAGELL